MKIVLRDVEAWRRNRFGRGSPRGLPPPNQEATNRHEQVALDVQDFGTSIGLREQAKQGILGKIFRLSGVGTVGACEADRCLDPRLPPAQDAITGRVTIVFHSAATHTTRLLIGALRSTWLRAKDVELLLQTYIRKDMRGKLVWSVSSYGSYVVSRFDFPPHPP